MAALTRSIGGGTAPARPVATVFRRLRRALWRTLDGLVSRHPDLETMPPPEFFRYPPF